MQWCKKFCFIFFQFSRRSDANMLLLLASVFGGLILHRTLAPKAFSFPNCICCSRCWSDVGNCWLCTQGMRLKNGWKENTNYSRKAHAFTDPPSKLLYLLIFDDDYNFLFITILSFIVKTRVARSHLLYQSYVYVRFLWFADGNATQRLVMSKRF